VPFLKNQETDKVQTLVVIFAAFIISTTDMLFQPVSTYTSEQVAKYTGATWM